MLINNKGFTIINSHLFIELSKIFRHNLELAFLRDGETAITETNIIGVMHDVSNSFTRDRLDPKVLRLLHLYPYKHAVLILNKVSYLSQVFKNLHKL